VDAKMPRRAWRSQDFDNDGGPLIVLPHELLGHWSGFQSDYERCIDARYPFDFFAVGPGLGVVVNGPDGVVYTAQWLRYAGQPDVILAAWESGAEDEQE
jgi:hypothetical protein